MERKAKVARLRFGQHQRGGTGPAFGDAANGAPFPAVVGKLHVVARCLRAGCEAQHEPAEFARPAEIDAEPLLAAAARIASPRGCELAVERVRRVGPAQRGRRANPGRWPFRSDRGKVVQLEIAHVERAAATLASAGDDELDGRDVVQRPILRRSPREFDVALLDRDQFPLVRKREVGTAIPPDVVAACVDQLDLQIVDRRVRTQPERDRIVVRQVDRQGAPRERVTCRAAQVEVEPQCGPLRIDDVMHARRHAVGCTGLPRGNVVEAVEVAYGRLRRGGMEGHDQQNGEHRAGASAADDGFRDARKNGRHPLTPPVIRPWM